MKKILSVLLSVCLLSISLVSVSAEENDKELELHLASQTMESYLEIRDWNNFKISSSEVLYDGNLDEYGFVFELNDGNQEGYGIVIKQDNKYIFVEGSIETVSPFKNLDQSCMNVYTTALNYYSYNPEQVTRSNRYFLNLETNEFVFQDEIITPRGQVDMFTNNNLSRAAVNGTKYLSSYSTNFVGVAQPNGSACIPTSSIMALKYLSNVGKLTLYGSNLTTLSTNLHLAMNSSKERVNDCQAKTGIDTWTSNSSNCSKRITFGSTYSYSPNVAEWNAVKEEIDGNFPVICMFRENIVGYSTTHATTMVGYQVVQLDTYDGQEVYYTIVKDPGNSSVPEKTVAWTYDNIYGYFILYVH